MGGCGGGVFSPTARVPWQQSRAGDVPGPWRSDPTVQILLCLERVVLGDKISPFTPSSDFMKPGGALITPGADSGSHWAHNLG